MPQKSSVKLKCYSFRINTAKTNFDNIKDILEIKKNPSFVPLKVMLDIQFNKSNIILIAF